MEYSVINVIITTYQVVLFDVAICRPTISTSHKDSFADYHKKINNNF